MAKYAYEIFLLRFFPYSSTEVCSPNKTIYQIYQRWMIDASYQSPHCMVLNRVCSFAVFVGLRDCIYRRIIGSIFCEQVLDFPITSLFPIWI